MTHAYPPDTQSQIPNTPLGKVYIVGAGPGPADLITVRGLRVLRQADVVLYDRLVPRELLDEPRPDAVRIFVGKAAGRHVMSQEAINRLLLDHARAGRTVVRLKGGDPFVFGRGGEEALALAQAGIPFEIVPGVTSAIAVPALAGVPVTHRGLSTAFAVVTGHEAPGKPRSPTDWEALARIPTLVVLMALKRTPEICRALIAAGRSPDTPAMLISRGGTPEQRALQGTLQSLPQMLENEPLPAPALLVAGPTVNLASILRWNISEEGESTSFHSIPSAASHFTSRGGEL